MSLFERPALPNQGIHWPDGFTPDDADLFAHNEILIDAPTDVVWSHLVDATRWPEWYQNAQNVQIESEPSDVLHASSRFGFETFGFHFDATVGEYVEGSRLGWFGDGKDIHGYHAWLLLPIGDGCRVVTEQVARGPGAIAIRRDANPDAMRGGDELWLAQLKQISEARHR